MSCFVQLSEDDAGVECKRWMRSVNKDTGKVQEAKREEPVEEPEVEEEEEEEVKPAKKGAAAKKGGEVKKEVKEKKKVEVKEEVKETPLTSAQKLELIERQFVPLIDKIVAANTELEVEVGFTLALHVLGELTDSKQQLALIGKIASTLAARPTEQTAVRMQWLTRLFNSPLLDAGAGLAVRSSIYSSLLRVALAAGAARELSGSYGDVDAWVAEWKLTKAQIAELYLLISQLAAQAEDTAESGLFTLRYLKTVSSGELPLAPAKPVAIAAVLSLLSSPDMPPYDELLNLSAVSQLRDDAKNAHIYKLLQIFAQDSIDSYTSLAAEKKDLLTGTGLTHDDVMRKLRTLTICSLGASSDRVTYAELQKKLGLAAPSDVEAVVIDAVLSGRVEAKLDQEKQIVAIQRCAPRSFTSASWRDLSAKLSLWQRNVHTVLQTLHDVQSNGGPSVDSH